jgi:hypothetical protein
VICPSAKTEPGFRKHWYKELEGLRKQAENASGLELVLDDPLADDERNEGIVWACHPSGREDIKLVLTKKSLTMMIWCIASTLLLERRRVVAARSDHRYMAAEAIGLSNIPR